MLYQLSYFRSFPQKSAFGEPLPFEFREPGFTEYATLLLEVGGDGFEPPKSKDNRFTVCPIWPLWKPPILLALSSQRGLAAPVLYFLLFEPCGWIAFRYP